MYKDSQIKYMQKTEKHGLNSEKRWCPLPDSLDRSIANLRGVQFDCNCYIHKFSPLVRSVTKRKESLIPNDLSLWRNKLY